MYGRRTAILAHLYFNNKWIIIIKRMTVRIAMRKWVKIMRARVHSKCNDNLILLFFETKVRNQSRKNHIKSCHCGADFADRIKVSIYYVVIVWDKRLFTFWLRSPDSILWGQFKFAAIINQKHMKLRIQFPPCDVSDVIEYWVFGATISLNNEMTGGSYLKYYHELMFACVCL